MGFQTTVNILNDGWGDVKDHPEDLIRAIEVGMNGRGDRYGDQEFPAGNHCNCIAVLPAHHADDYKLCLSGGNMLVSLDQNGLKQLSPQHRQEVLRKAKDLLAWGCEIVEELEKSESET
jgi:hypothetical protein